MPIYAYQCAQCGHRFEELILSQNAAATLTCPQCRSDQLVRQLSPFATTVGGGKAARQRVGHGSREAECRRSDDVVAASSRPLPVPGY